MTTPLTLQDRFAFIIRALCGSLGARYAGPNNFPQPLFVALHGFLAGRIRRFRSLVARAQAGIIPACPALVRVRPAAVRRPRGLVLSRRRGWLLTVIQADAATANSQLSYLIAQPEMVELIARAPTLGRLLRPLAHMLAMELPPSLRRPPRPRPVRKPAPAKAPPATPAPPAHMLRSRRPSIVIGRKRLPRIVFGPG